MKWVVINVSNVVGVVVLQVDFTFIYFKIVNFLNNKNKFLYGIKRENSLGKK